MDTQRFIELGEGFGDVFELCELIRTNSPRIHRAFILRTDDPKNAVSLAVALLPAGDGHFMPIYICREGVKEGGTRQRLFTEALEEAGVSLADVKVRPSGDFGSREDYYRHLTGILRMNRLLPTPELMTRMRRQIPPL
ncbi:methylthioribose kinase [Bhargavaea ullalensis]|uniref:DNA-binding LacI/PurR family transcriptional regulator n=1 Tax=Bhargavaea ullalensis TaxID=1265685 RepID=A0ABV2GC38_9BACL